LSSGSGTSASERPRAAATEPRVPGGDVDRPFLVDVMDEAERYNAFLLDRVLDWAGEAGRVLDFGAGNGRFSFALRDRGLEVHAVEPHADLRARIAARGVATHPDLEALGERRFDFVFSLNVLEHVEDDVGTLRLLAAHLEPGGRLFLYVPAFHFLWTANDDRVGHLRRYTKRTLLPSMRAAGFAVRRARYVDCLGCLAALAYRVAGDPTGDLDPRTVRFYDRFGFPLSRALDRFLGLGHLVGKNLLVEAVREAAPASCSQQASPPPSSSR
jgi:SAM-dependent methyltransferase